MNPHFIFNVLGSIQNFMMQNDTRKASDFLSQFASLTRATLNNSAAETISLADEISMLKNYIELEKMRKGDKFDYQIQYDEEMEIDFIQIPPMLIQPFIENAIKHGLKKMESGGFLRIKITDKTDWIEFEIEDNGEGIQESSAKQKDHKSMAMEIFEKRRKLIQQKHKKDFGFELQNLRDVNPDLSGVRIRIDVPIIEK
jgi:sensor histidine kinase YesM